ncbi:MAG: DUF1836 domain-containing protein [Clostridia bacterium]|nr:DUF1836 domain-containing protein [Clostridia bacterium]
MILQFNDKLIPGTKLKQSEMDGLTGLDFLKKVFFISDGVMLTQIRDISGIDSSTLQNWTKRGWVANSKLKKYNIDQVAHILIINMLRSCMQLDKIDFLIHYINGEIDNPTDDIISDSVLYDYICKILQYMTEKDACPLSEIGDYVAKITTDYVEPVEGARDRLNRALEVIVITYYATRIKNHANKLLDKLES